MDQSKQKKKINSDYSDDGGRKAISIRRWVSITTDTTSLELEANFFLRVSSRFGIVVGCQHKLHICTMPVFFVCSLLMFTSNAF